MAAASLDNFFSSRSIDELRRDQFSSRIALSDTIKNKRVPADGEIHAALMERWDEVVTEVGQSASSFFLQARSAAAGQLNILAKRLGQVLQQDDHAVLLTMFDLLQKTDTPGNGGSQSSPADPTKYLQSLQERTGYIDIRGLQVASDEAGYFPIHEMYIPLTTLFRPDGERTDQKKRFDVHDGLGIRRDRRVALDIALKSGSLVIEGDPGAGKTTFLNRVTNIVCRQRLGRPGIQREGLGLDVDLFPILIDIRELSEHIGACLARNVGPTGNSSPAWLAHFLATTSGDRGEGLDEAFFRSQLVGGSALVLLDGLDEAPSELHRKSLARMVQNGQEAYKKCRFVLTCRPAAYQGEAVLRHFDHVRIDALEDEAIETFLTRWCQRLLNDRPVELKRHLGELLGALRSRPEIRRLARNPVMLTALAVVHWNERRFPEQRAELYESIIRWLARSRERKQGGRASPELCVALHQDLALAMQDHPEGRKTQVTRHWAARQIADKWRSEPEKEHRIRNAEEFLERDELDSGIVVRRGNNIMFWHLTFQEYLAARALAGKDWLRDQLLCNTEKITKPEWREVIVLTAGALHHQGEDRVDAMFSKVLEQLFPEASLSDRAACFGLLGAAVQDLAPFKYQPLDERYDKVAEAVLAVFDAKQSPSIDIKVSIGAAEALGLRGDPRFVPWNLERNWVEIPAGEFLMGAQSRDSAAPNYDPIAYDDESPVHRVRVPAYRMGRYPVTVAEYQRFVDDGGYGKEVCWQAGGFEKWEDPSKWDEQMFHPNRPVTGVNWYEAVAYAAWAGCRLPTEAEWEYAARGPKGRRYPWGEPPVDAFLANYGDGKISCPTPVGVYPLGGTPDGIMDLAGNVWEWCQDAWHESYHGATRDGMARTGNIETTGCVLRGGSWVNDDFDVRSAIRDCNGPHYRDDNIGFRLVATPGPT